MRLWMERGRFTPVGVGLMGGWDIQGLKDIGRKIPNIEIILCVIYI